MSLPNGQLPPGWTAEWNASAQRYVFIETATGKAQWEPPHNPMLGPPRTPADPITPMGFAPQPAGYSKRRQYATFADPTAAGDSSYNGAPPSAGGSQGTDQQHQQLFTPGLEGSTFVQQQTQGQAYYEVPTQPQPEYLTTPSYGKPTQTMSNLTRQFGEMGIQKPFQLTTANLLGPPPDPRELNKPPPEIRLPPNAAVTNAPTVNSHHSYSRCTLGAIPTTSTLLSKSKIPLALVLSPYRSLKEGDPEVPLVTDRVIARCRRCRVYINPFVTFVDGGNRWKCCMCGLVNDVPQLFDWDEARNQPGDRWSRAELNHGVVDFIAPSEYLVREPQPTVYVFLIDVSYAAVQSGMLATVSQTILQNLDRLPNNDGTTKVALIGFDTSLYFFHIPTGSSEFNTLVVPDVDDPFLPKPIELLVNVTEARSALDSLFSKLNGLFSESSVVGNAMGSALKAGLQLMSPIGGKMFVVSTSMPNLGPGALKNREDPKILGTAKESSLLQVADSWYKQFSIDCSKAHTSVDMFLGGSTYQDVATLGALPHYTCGQTYFYPAFNATRPEDAVKFAHEFGEVMAMPIMLEAVMRVRGTRGLRMSSYHGNFFVRSTDLLAMPAVPQDQGYVVEVEIEEALTQAYVIFQTAVLHSTAFGERRIRVVTTAVPTTTNLAEIYASVDEIAVIAYLANKAVEKSLSSTLDSARDAVTAKVIEMINAYKSSMTASGAGGQMAIADNMKMIPVLALGLTKTVALRKSSQIPPDLRAYAQSLLTTMPAQLLVPYLHPNFYALHSMPPEAGLIGEHGIVLPPALPLTSERLERHGLFLIEDGQTMFLWLGRDAVPQLTMDVFNSPSYEAVRTGKATLEPLDNDFSQRVNAIIAKTREMRRGPYYPHLYVVKDDGEMALRMWTLSCLILDRADQMPSYQQYIGQLKDKTSSY